MLERWPDLKWYEDRKFIFSFCKTAMKPYDAYVKAILIRAKLHYGELIRVSSDGDWSDWEKGRKICRDIFGEKGDPYPFDERQDEDEDEQPLVTFIPSNQVG